MRKRKKRVFQRGGQGRRIRIVLLAGGFLLAFSGLTYRAIHLHLAQDSKLEKIARTQYRAQTAEVLPRGNIYDAEGEELAISVPAYSLAIRPKEIKDSQVVIQKLSSVLGLSKKEVSGNVKSGKKFVWVKHHLSPHEKERLEKLSLEGIAFVKSSRRFYPNREIGSQVLGAVSRDNEGLGGVELYYNRYLRGEGKKESAYRDARGETFRMEDFERNQRKEPHHLHLTLKKNIQYVTERELKVACSEHRAKSCTAIVLEPKTASVLAMASYPNFNPNSYQSYDFSRWRNRAVTDTYEPGSTFKVILAAAAMEDGKIKPGERFFCENGSLKIGRTVIHDHEKFKYLSLSEIIKVSSNIGTYKVAQKIGKNAFAETIREFGFGEKTHVDFPGEVRGAISPQNSWGQVRFANISFGQGLRVTPLQLAVAYAAIANGGILHQPRFVSRITDSRGDVVMERELKGRRVLKKETVKLLTEMMKGVTTEGGTATLASIPGYQVAGKTGTTQKYVQGKYSSTKYVSSFLGIVPADSPELVILVMIDEPQDEIYGGIIAAPVFRKIASASLREIGVPPEKSSVPVIRKVQKKEMIDENGGTPDFRGLSKRKVLAFLDKEGWQGEVIGVGFAVAQEPAPGQSLKKGEVFKVYFKPE